MMQDFDTALGMFREEAKPVDYRRLQFLRWLAEQGGLEHPVAGPPSGPFTDGRAEVELPVEPRQPAVGRSVSTRLH
jgi:hypothetical protein